MGDILPFRRIPHRKSGAPRTEIERPTLQQFNIQDDSCGVPLERCPLVYSEDKPSAPETAEYPCPLVYRETDELGFEFPS